MTKKSTASSAAMYVQMRTVLPIVYMFTAVFLLRSDVRLFFAATFVLLAAMYGLSRKQGLKQIQLFALALITLSSIGLSAAAILTIEKIELLKNPSHVTSCSFSPIVACSPVIGSPQASAFDGIPNPIFGVFGFACLLAAGMTILAGADKLKKVWWYTLFAGVIFGVGFCMWLIHEGIYEIGALCLYCMSVWMVTFSLFWLTLSHMLEQKILIIKPSVSAWIIKNRDVLITLTIGIIILMIYFRWSDYWQSLL